MNLEFDQLQAIIHLHIILRNISEEFISYNIQSIICNSIIFIYLGLAIAQCVFVYVLANISNRNLLENYYKLAQPFQSIYYMFFVICCLSVLDRYVIRSPMTPRMTNRNVP